MNRRTINTVLVVLLVVVIILLGVAIAKPKANVRLESSPHAAALRIDGKPAHTGTLYLKPGAHTATGTFDGFASKNILFTVEQGKPVRVIVLLMPNSAKGTDYIRNHPDEQDEREQLGGTQFDKDSATIRRLYPVINELPHEGPNFRVDYGASKKTPDDPYAVALYITVPRPGDEALALHWLQFAGYSPQDYEIIYQYEIGRD